MPDKFFPRLSSVVRLKNLPDQLGFIKTDNPSPANIAGDAREGSGGNYLSNEIMYRIARLRDSIPSTVKTGHYHLANPNPNPHPSKIPGITAVPFTLQEIIDETENAIKRALQGI